MTISRNPSSGNWKNLETAPKGPHQHHSSHKNHRPVEGVDGPPRPKPPNSMAHDPSPRSYCNCKSICLMELWWYVTRNPNWKLQIEMRRGCSEPNGQALLTTGNQNDPKAWTMSLQKDVKILCSFRGGLCKETILWLLITGVWPVRKYIYIQKGTLSGPHFSTFLKMQCFFATSCLILYVHIPVMVLLEIHTDCQTSSEVAKECPESHEGLQGKGRRKNKHSVCIHIWLPLGERWQRTKRFFFFRAFPLS